jgi:hypothetical protein
MLRTPGSVNNAHYLLPKLIKTPNRCISSYSSPQLPKLELIQGKSTATAVSLCDMGHSP